MSVPNTAELFADMKVDEAQKMYQELKKHYILFLESQGLSIREISRRLGGATPATVLTLLRLYRGETL